MSEAEGPGAPSEVMRARHAAVEAPRAAVAAIVVRATGGAPAQIERVVRGYDSEVYRVEAAAGRLFVRIRRYGSVSYASEAWAIAQCGAAGAPVPEILLVEPWPFADGEHEVMVQRAVPGQPLSELQGRLSQRELAHIWAQAGQALAQIHSVPAQGFYKMRQPGVWDFPDLASVAASAHDSRHDDLAQLGRAGLAVDIAALEAMLEAGAREAAVAQPWLLHGDFLPGHLFVDDELRLTGVIDFGEFQGGARVFDLATLRMSAPDVDMGWLRVGYGEQEPFDDRLERRLLLAGAEHQIGYLAHYLREGNAHEAAPVLRALQATLAVWGRD